MKAGFRAIKENLDIVAMPESTGARILLTTTALSDTVLTALRIPDVINGTISNNSEEILPFSIAGAVGFGYLAVRNWVLRRQAAPSEHPSPEA